MMIRNPTTQQVYTHPVKIYAGCRGSSCFDILATKLCILIAILVLSVSLAIADASDPPETVPHVTLVWDAVVHPDLTGYRMYWRYKDEQYSDTRRSSDIDKQYTTYTYTGPFGRKVYFVVTAFCATCAGGGEAESDHSNEVHWYADLEGTLIQLK